MNSEKILQLAAHIEQLDPSRFDMDLFGYSEDGRRLEKAGELIHNCGTCGCIAGWANALFAPDEEPDNELMAGEVLGLNSYDYSRLFFPRDLNVPWDVITPAQAAAVLRNLVETGRVEWTKFV